MHRDSEFPETSPSHEHHGPAGGPPPGPPPFEPNDPRRSFMKIGFIERTQRKVFASPFGQYGVHPSQGFALSMVVHKPGRSQRELADDMRLERATVTVTLQKLERGGFIRREPDPDDQRVMRIYPTEKGIEAETSIGLEIERFHKACTDSLTSEQHHQLSDLLQKLEDAIIEYQEGLNR